MSVGAAIAFQNSSGNIARSPASACGLGIPFAAPGTIFVRPIAILPGAVLVTLLPQAYKLIGAVIATAMNQVAGGAVPLFCLFAKNSGLLRLGKAHFDGRAVLKACANGVSAYGVLMHVSIIFSGTFTGYAIGIAPVVSYHCGAGNNGELKSLLRKRAPDARTVQHVNSPRPLLTFRRKPYTICFGSSVLHP